MATDRTLLTVADLVNRAAAVVDPTGDDPGVAELVVRYEDDDAPVRGVLENIEEHLRWGADEDPPVVLAQAVALYLAHRPDAIETDAEQLLQLATRAEFDGQPPETVARWLDERAA
jgi:hypothetical protein